MFKCTVCGKTFKRKSGLASHLVYLHGEAKKSKRLLPGRVATLESRLDEVIEGVKAALRNADTRLHALEGSQCLRSTHDLHHSTHDLHHDGLHSTHDLPYT